MTFLNNKYAFILISEYFDTLALRHVIEEKSLNFSIANFCGKVSNKFQECHKQYSLFFFMLFWLTK